MSEKNGKRKRETQTSSGSKKILSTYTKKKSRQATRYHSTLHTHMRRCFFSKHSMIEIKMIALYKMPNNNVNEIFLRLLSSCYCYRIACMHYCFRFDRCRDLSCNNGAHSRFLWVICMRVYGGCYCWKIDRYFNFCKRKNIFCRFDRHISA